MRLTYDFDKLFAAGKSHLLSCLRIRVLHQGLEARLLLKCGNLLHRAKSREHQVQRVQRHVDVWLCTTVTISGHHVLICQATCCRPLFTASGD